MKFLKLFIVLSLILSLSTVSFAEDKKVDEGPYLDQQMILMGLYIYGVNQEVSKKVPDLDELNFLSESLLSVVNQINKSKRSKRFHMKLDDLVQNMKTLKEATKANQRDKSLVAAKEVIQSCSNCHNPQSKKPKGVKAPKSNFSLQSQ